MMSEWLMLCFFVLFVLALSIAVCPFRTSLTRALVFMLCLLSVFSLSAYYQWGSWTAWQAHERDLAKQEEAKALLASIGSPQELVERLKARLDDSPASARGWYLLARLYAGQGQWTLARDAYAKSHQLNPDDEGAALGYVESLWQLGSQQYTDEIRQRLHDILKKNPGQPDALSMLAMDAYQQKQYQSAIDYWRRVLILVPEQSEEANALRKAITRAQRRLD